MEISASHTNETGFAPELDRTDGGRGGIPIPRELKILGGITPFKQEQFVLQPEDDAPPFFRLDAKEGDLAFHVLDPFAVAPEYAPEISPEDEKLLGLTEGESPEIWTIVNLNRGAADATVNLAAPILVNFRTGVARQIIPLNVQDCPVRQRLFTND